MVPDDLNGRFRTPASARSYTYGGLHAPVEGQMSYEPPFERKVTFAMNCDAIPDFPCAAASWLITVASGSPLLSVPPFIRPKNEAERVEFSSVSFWTPSYSFVRSFSDVVTKPPLKVPQPSVWLILVLGMPMIFA